MSVINLKANTDQLSIGALAVGNFDGVHLGHQELLAKAVALSQNNNEESGLLTFLPHPRELFNPAEYSRIFEHEQNFELIQSFGISKIFLQDFNEIVSELSAHDFLSEIFLKVSFKTLVVGFDFKLGKGRSGDHKDIKKWCDQHSVSLVVVPCRDFEGEKVSSSLIKSLLLNGDVKKASTLLGMPYFHKDFVRTDQGLGEKMGFPTLNLYLSPDVAIKKGVYSTVCKIHGKEYCSISNIGFRPTVSGKRENLILETHILEDEFVTTDQNAEVKIVFKDFIRSEKKFGNIDELRAQITLDVHAARSTLS